MKKIIILLYIICILFVNNHTVEAESLQDEMTRIELKAQEYKNGIEYKNKNYYYHKKLYQFWENEINSLWSRLSKELTPKMKKKVLAQQRAWIKRKDKNSKSFGELIAGRKFQKFFEIKRETDMTRARSYILAKYLAEIRNEKFTIPKDLNETIHILEPFLDDIFKQFEGQWIAKDKIKKNSIRIGIERSDSCLYGIEGSKWTLWTANGIILSDNNVYSYTKEYIIFKIVENKEITFYKLFFNGDGSFTLAAWNSLKELMNYGENPLEKNFKPKYFIYCSKYYE